MTRTLRCEDSLTSETRSTPAETHPDGAGWLPQLFTEYQYDDLGRLTSQFAPRPVGSSGSLYAETQFSYYPNGLLQKETFFDRDGDSSNDWYIEYEYDHLDRQTKLTTPNATNSGTTVTDYEYNQLGYLAKELMPAPDAQSSRPIVEYDYDSLVPGQQFSPGIYLTEVSAPSGSGTGTTKYEYDSAGRVIAEYRPDPSTGLPSAGAYQKWTYERDGRLETQEILLSNASSYVYETIDFDYDQIGRITSQGTTFNRDVYEYDDLGNLFQVTDPLGRETQYEYDDWGRVIASHRLSSGTIHDSLETTYDSLGRVASSTQTAGSTSLTNSYEYDALDRQTKITGPSGAYQDFRYRSWGPLERYRNEYLQPTYYNHDAAGRLIEVDQTSDRYRTEYDYNAFGRVETETRHLDGSNTAVYGYEYDDLGRLTEETLPTINGASVGDTTVYDYDLAGNLTSLTDPSGNVTTWEYDHRNRQTKEEITVGGQTLNRTWSYFVNDTVNWYKDRNGEWIGQNYQYVYGAGHRVTQEKWWDTTYAGGLTYQFDSTGLLTEEIKTHDPGTGTYIGAVKTNLEFFHDDLGRVETTRDYLSGDSDDATWRAVDVISGYDSFDRRTSSGIRYKEVQTSGGSEKHRWDSSTYITWTADSEVSSVTQYTPVTGTETTSGINDGDSKRRADLTYFANGDLKTITRTEGTGATLSDSLISTYTLADGGWHQGRLGSIVHSGLTGTQTTQSYSWTYEDGGRIKTFTPPEGQRTYTYDDLGQLTDVTGTQAQSQDYDSNGNRTESSFTVTEHNRLTSDGTYTYQYDAEGRRTRRTLIADNSFEVYDWSIRGELVSVTQYDHNNSGSNYNWKAEYEYDGTGRRIRRKVDSNGDQTFDIQQRFVYDTNVLDPSFDEVVLILDETQSWDAGTDTFDPDVESRFMNGPLLDQVFAEEDGNGEIFWLLQDNQQTVRDVARFTQLDGDAPHEAELVNHLDYDAFGKIASQTDSTHQPLQTYTGQILDDQTGLMYYDARWFDPPINQFISEDPLGFTAGDTNLKRYVGNGNPNATDPSGMQVKINRQKLRRVGTAWLIYKNGNAPRIITGATDESILSIYEQNPNIIAVHYAGDSNDGKIVPQVFVDPGKSIPSKNISLSIAFVGEWKVDVAASWNQLTNEAQQCLRPNDQERIRQITDWLHRLQNSKRHISIYHVTISAHGSFGTLGGGTFNLEKLKDKTSPEYKLLKVLGQRLTQNAVIELKACSVADGRRGKEFLQLFADITGAKVIGYTDVYAVVPHGQQYIATPGAAAPKKGRLYPPYPGSGKEVKKDVEDTVRRNSPLPRLP